jgi:hypothetical protein
MNILQTKWFVKVSCADYLTRILMEHAWRDLKASNLHIPMRSDPVYQRQLETAIRPRNETEQLVIQRQMGFSYRGATGELIYALVAAHPDISFATTKVTSSTCALSGIEGNLCFPQQYLDGWFDFFGEKFHEKIYQMWNCHACAPTTRMLSPLSTCIHMHHSLFQTRIGEQTPAIGIRSAVSSSW